MKWLERQKQKALVKRELNKLKPSLGLINLAEVFQPTGWKKFKEDYSITQATICVLVEAPGEEFFVAAKLILNKNKIIEEILPYAKEFFRVFLAMKGSFQKPTGRAYFRAYDASNNKVGSWPANS